MYERAVQELGVFVEGIGRRVTARSRRLLSRRVLRGADHRAGLASRLCLLLLLLLRFTVAAADVVDAGRRHVLLRGELLVGRQQRRHARVQSWSGDHRRHRSVLDRRRILVDRQAARGDRPPLLD